MRGDWGQSGYNATKALVMNFVQSLALDYGPRGVRLNAVAPAFTQTEATAGVGDDEASLAPFVNRIALGRPGRAGGHRPGRAVPGQRRRRVHHRRDADRGRRDVGVDRPAARRR